MTSREIRDKKGKFIKGFHYNSKTEFKKGKPSPRKGIRKPGWVNKTSFKGRKSLWEKDVREYQSVHRWILKEAGQPKVCDFCRDTTSKLYHWANKSRKYQRDRSDWLRLCHKCHRAYDNRLIAVERASNLILKTYFNDGLILIIGNGGSLEISNHLASELLGKFEKKNRSPIPAISLSSPTNITAISNDFGFEFSFSKQVEALGNKKSLLICFTTSDYNEETKHNINLWKALGVAINKIKMKTIVFGSHKTKRIRNYANCFVKGGGLETAEIQEDHLALLHLVCRFLERKL